MTDQVTESTILPLAPITLLEGATLKAAALITLDGLDLRAVPPKDRAKLERQRHALITAIEKLNEARRAVGDLCEEAS